MSPGDQRESRGLTSRAPWRDFGYAAARGCLGGGHLVLCGLFLRGCRIAEAAALSARLLKRGELSGFTPAAPVSYRNIREYLATTPGLSPALARAEIAQAQRQGFKAVMYEWLLDAQGRPNGLCSVVQYGSASLAKAGLATTVHFATIQGLTRERLRLSAAPGAVGLSLSNSGAHTEKHRVRGRSVCVCGWQQVDRAGPQPPTRGTPGSCGEAVRAGTRPPSGVAAQADPSRGEPRLRERPLA